ncbi:hypothetical protein ACSBR1_001879 [Camellia fascicularis]
MSIRLDGEKSKFVIYSKQVGERDYFDYTKQDHKNYLQSKQQRDLQYGEEVWAILWHFENLSLENPSFYYAVQLDVEEKISNMFWADTQMIIDYSHFGDVLSFDMTYRTNKEYQPVGTKIYFLCRTSMVIFGTALLYDKTVASFQWLFDTLFTTMSGKKPKTTFQDPAIAKAIPLVMPETYHRICTWQM